MYLLILNGYCHTIQIDDHCLDKHQINGISPSYMFVECLDTCIDDETQANICESEIYTVSATAKGQSMFVWL